jgi:long-chain acyl-CoA synthetase
MDRDAVGHMTGGMASTSPSMPRTLAELFASRVKATPRATAYRHFDVGSNTWISTDWAGIAERANRWARALSALALPRGARVAVLLPNGLDAVCIDQATLAIACTPVPLHAVDNAANIAYILKDSESSVLVASRREQWNAIAAAGPLPTLRIVILADDTSDAPASAGEASVISLRTWLARGEADLSVAPPTEDDLAALVYTSGTTGRPKGVMLSHRNIVSNVFAALARVPAGPNDVFLSFLPLSHMFERTAGYYLPIAAGACVAFSRSVGQLAEDLKIVEPSVLVSVPRIYERVYARLRAMLEGTPIRRRAFDAAVAVGWRRFRRRQGLPIDEAPSRMFDELLWLLVGRSVSRKLTSQFGGRLRLAVSGGAPLAEPIARCFLGLGVPVLQGYGMTELSPVVAVNTLADNDPATVGRALPGVEVRIGANLELMVKGPNVMRGYWRREADTTRTINDGWLHTGDQATTDKGRIRILGRLKEIIVTSTGEKIAPVDLEIAIATDPLFEQVYAFGDDRPFIACLVVLNLETWGRMAGEMQLDPTMPQSLLEPAARRALLDRIRRLTAAFPHYAQPRAVWPTLEPWTIENGLLTPTLKPKRKELAARFAAEIDALYRKPIGGSNGKA